MASPAATPTAQSPPRSLHWAFLLLAMVNIAVGRWKPGSFAASFVSYAFIGSITIWFGLRIRAGYRRRWPYWTRESWLRFIRLAWMPVAATIFVLAMSTETGIRLMRSTPSTTRPVWIGVLVALLLFGALGLVAVVEWLFQGPPSEQFTRRGWIPWRRSGATHK